MTPPRIVLDTSALIAATFSHENGHREAAALMAALDAERSEVIVPALFIPELMGALRRNKYSPVRIRQLVHAFRVAHVTIVPLDVSLADQAGEIALLQGVKGSDSVFLALARSLAIPLVTLDREQLDRAPADLEVLTPGQAMARLRPG